MRHEELLAWSRPSPSTRGRPSLSSEGRRGDRRHSAPFRLHIRSVWFPFIFLPKALHRNKWLQTIVVMSVLVPGVEEVGRSHPHTQAPKSQGLSPRASLGSVHDAWRGTITLHPRRGHDPPQTPPLQPQTRSALLGEA